MILLIQPGILIFCTFSFNSVPAGLCQQISKQVLLVLQPMSRSVARVFNLRLTSVPAYSFTGLSIVMLTYKKSSLLLELFIVKC